MRRGMRTGQALFPLGIEPGIPRVRPWTEILATGAQATWFDVHDFGNAKIEDAKVEDAPPPIPPVVPPVHVVFIDQREHFTTAQKFSTKNDLLERVREKARKLDFCTVIGKSDNGGNRRMLL